MARMPATSGTIARIAGVKRAIIAKAHPIGEAVAEDGSQDGGAEEPPDVDGPARHQDRDRDDDRGPRDERAEDGERLREGEHEHEAISEMLIGLDRLDDAVENVAHRRPS